MKQLIMFLFCITLAMPAHAGSCQDVSEAASSAIQERNNRVAETQNATMPDPESERDALSGCLSSINSIGESFSLGISIPDMDQLISGMCKQVDSMIQSKISEVQNQALSSINGVGANNQFKVYGTGSDLVVQIKEKLK